MVHRSSSLWVCRNRPQVLSGWLVPLVVSLLNPLLVCFSFEIDTMQPRDLVMIGAISDSSTSPFRRRYWVITSTAVLCLSALVLAYCREISSFFVDLFGGGAGSWDPKRQIQVRIAGYSELACCLIQSAGRQHRDWLCCCGILFFRLFSQCAPSITA